MRTELEKEINIRKFHWKIIRKYKLRTMVRQIIGVLSGTHKRHKQSGNQKSYFNFLREMTLAVLQLVQSKL